MIACSHSSVLLRRFALMRLRLQQGGALTTEDVQELLSAVDICEFVDDDIFRHSLILLIETACRRIWQVSEFAQSPVQDCRDFASVMIQKIGGTVQRMLFNEFGNGPVKQVKGKHLYSRKHILSKVPQLISVGISKFPVKYAQYYFL
ncbi:hypothetical protein Aduo_014125 [Ancylostoma duodenale]